MKRNTVFFLSVWSISVYGKAVLDKPAEINCGREDGMALTMLAQPPAAASKG